MKFLPKSVQAPQSPAKFIKNESTEGGPCFLENRHNFFFEIDKYVEEGVGNTKEFVKEVIDNSSKKKNQKPKAKKQKRRRRL